MTIERTNSLFWGLWRKTVILPVDHEELVWSMNRRDFIPGRVWKIEKAIKVETPDILVVDGQRLERELINDTPVIYGPPTIFYGLFIPKRSYHWKP